MESILKFFRAILFAVFFINTTYAQGALGIDIEHNINRYSHPGSVKTINALYKANGYKPLWVGANNSRRFAQLIDALGDPLFNYKFKQFDQDKIIDLSLAIDDGSASASDRAKLDILATQSFLELIHFIRIGDVDWAMVKRKMANLKASQDVRAVWEIHPKSMPSGESVLKSIQHQSIKSYLKSQLPLIDQYLALSDMLDRYRKMPKFKKIPYGKTLKRGSYGNRIRMIKKLLKATGDFPKNESAGAGYTSSLSRAIESFKKRFNLTQGDYIDNKTVKYLNTAKSKYIQKIITNLDMLKLQPHRLEANHVEINVPEFKLRYYQNGSEVFSSDIIVGRIDRPTPIFNDKIEYMVLNPTWTITANLVRRDLIPMLKKHPSYLKEHNIHLFQGGKEVPLNMSRLLAFEKNKKAALPYRFVQYPGVSNALGKVKFIFPNKYSVYLHDTDNHSLFKYRYRVFSSGCMRVKKPFGFMYELLQNGGLSYSKSKINSIFASNKPTTIKLKHPIPVHIMYQTVRRENGKDYFFYDVYMYEQIIYESTAGHKKATFRVPAVRLTKINRIGSRIR